MAHALRRTSEKPSPEFCSGCPERARDERLLREKDGVIHRQEVFDQEVSHRLLNSLQMVVSLLSLQSRTESNAEAASHLSDAASRVATIARVHRHLHSMDGRQTVAFRKFLDGLCADYAKMLIEGEHSSRDIIVEGTDVELPTAVGIPLGLIVSELLTNAIKHGKGRITVKLEAQSGHAISVCNDGSTLPQGFDPAASEGLGMKLVLSLVEQVGGELRIDRGDNNDGTRFTVLFG